MALRHRLLVNGSYDVRATTGVVYLGKTNQALQNWTVLCGLRYGILLSQH